MERGGSEPPAFGAPRGPKRSCLACGRRNGIRSTYCHSKSPEDPDQGCGAALRIPCRWTRTKKGEPTRAELRLRPLGVENPPDDAENTMQAGEVNASNVSAPTATTPAASDSPGASSNAINGGTEASSSTGNEESSFGSPLRTGENEKPNLVTAAGGDPASIQGARNGELGAESIPKIGEAKDLPKENDRERDFGIPSRSSRDKFSSSERMETDTSFVGLSIETFPGNVKVAAEGSEEDHSTLLILASYASQCKRAGEDTKAEKTRQSYSACPEPSKAGVGRGMREGQEGRARKKRCKLEDDLGLVATESDSDTTLTGESSQGRSLTSLAQT